MRNMKVSVVRFCLDLKKSESFSAAASSLRTLLTATDLVNLLYFLRPVSPDYTDFVKEFEQDG